MPQVQGERKYSKKERKPASNQDERKHPRKEKLPPKHQKTYLPPLPSVAGAVIADAAAHVEEVAAVVKSAAAEE